MSSQLSDPSVLRVHTALSEGDLQKAEMLCRELLDDDTNNPEARYCLGLAQARAGRVHQAVEEWQALLRSAPRHVGALINLGVALSRQGRHDEAIVRLRSALALDPSPAQVHYILGQCLLATDQVALAVDVLQAAIVRDSSHVQAHCTLGEALQRLGRTAEGINALVRAAHANPGSGDIHYALGVALHRAGHVASSLLCYDRATFLLPQLSEPWRDRARALETLRRLPEALSSYQRAIALTPTDCNAMAGALSCCVRMCDWNNAAAYRRRLEDSPGGLQAVHPFLALSVCEQPEQQLLVSTSRAKAIQQADSTAAPIVLPCPAAAARLRIAYVSSDFRDHAVAHLLCAILERHDRRQFEIHAVSLLAEPQESEVGRRSRRAVDHFHDASTLNDEHAVQWLRRLNIDIAVDMNGYSAGGRPAIFARRVAPVQVSYLGYAGTVGAAYMDYVLADEVVIPAGEERWYAEQVVRLPGCYLPNDDRRQIGARTSREQAGLPEQGLVLCAFTNAYKLNRPVFEIWMRLLLQSPGSVLWLRDMGESARENLCRHAASVGVSVERLNFAGHVANIADHLARLSLADLYLDTLPYNAHSTACDALWAGVPVLTCQGRSFASRVAASALTAVGLPELITHSLEHYERRGLELVRDPEQLGRLKARLERQRIGSALFDTAAYTRHLESAYRHMHERACSGQPPAAFAVSK